MRKIITLVVLCITLLIGFNNKTYAIILGNGYTPVGNTYNSTDYTFSYKVENKDIDICANGVYISFTESTGKPFADANSRTQVPLRVTMESLGADVDWNQSTQCARVSKGGVEVVIPMNTEYYYVNGEIQWMDTQSVVVNNRIYLPIRYVVEAFGSRVYWDQYEKTVYIDPSKTSIWDCEIVNIPSANDLANIFKDKKYNISTYIDVFDGSTKYLLDSDIITKEEYDNYQRINQEIANEVVTARNKLNDIQIYYNGKKLRLNEDYTIKYYSVFNTFDIDSTLITKHRVLVIEGINRYSGRKEITLGSDKAKVNGYIMD